MTAFVVHQRPTSAFSKPRAHWLDTAQEWLTIGLLAFATLAFGSVEPWSEQLVIAGTALLVLCFACRLLILREQWVVSIAMVPIALFTLLAAAQLLPLPVGLLARVSPSTLALWEQLQGPQTGKLSLSLYSTGTWHDLRLLLAVIAIFIVVLNAFREVRQIRRLLIAITILGAAVALLALTQDLTEADKIYWTFDSELSQARAGPFIHYNHYSQFMNLALGAALALLLLEIQTASASSAHRGRRHAVSGASNALPRWVWAVSLFLVLGATTIILSLSRGGILSMLIAFAATGALIGIRNFGRSRWLAVLIALAVFGVVLFTGFDAAYSRLATVGHFSESYDNRWQIVKNIAANWHRFPLLGTGLGTHDMVYPMFDLSAHPHRAVYAENEYAQMLEEMGAIGLGLVLLFVAAIAGCYARCVIGSSRSEARPIALGLGAGLLAILIHSFSDFGQHLPANALLTSVFCAVLVSLSRSTKNGRAIPSVQDAWRSRVGAAGALCTVAILAWAVVLLDPIRRADAAWQAGQVFVKQFQQQGWQGSADDSQELLIDAQTASDLSPKNVEYRYLLNAYRWQISNADQEEKTAEPGTDAQDPSRVSDMVAELHDAQRICPTFGLPYSLAGQLRLLVLNDPAGADEIRKGYLLAPSEPATAFAAGSLEIREGKWDQSLETFRRCRMLGYPFSPIADLYLADPGHPDLAIALAGNDPTTRLELAEKLRANPAYQDLAEKLAVSARADRRRELEQECQSATAESSELAALADLYVLDHNEVGAIALYRRALAGNYLQTTWRMELAKALARTGKTEAALDEARVCLRQNPGLADARQIIIGLTAGAAAPTEKRSEK